MIPMPVLRTFLQPGSKADRSKSATTTRDKTYHSLGLTSRDFMDLYDGEDYEDRDRGAWGEDRDIDL